MLALVIGHRGEFAKDRASVLSGKPLLAIPHCCRKHLVSPFCLCFPPSDCFLIFSCALLRLCGC